MSIATDQIIKELCRETGEPGFHNYTTIQGCVLDGIRSLNIFSMPCWSVKTLPITPFSTYDWPCDCVKPLLTALKRNGHYYLLEVSEDLLEIMCPNAPQSPSPSDTVYDVHDFFQLDGFVQAFGWGVWSWGLGELYGANTLLPPNGVVIHDKQNRRSFIKRCKLFTGDEVTAFFKSDGLSECPEFVPAEAKEVIEGFALQKYFRVRNPSLSMQIRNGVYKEHLHQVESLYQQGDEQQWTRAMYESVKSSPKF